MFQLTWRRINSLCFGCWPQVLADRYRRIWLRQIYILLTSRVMLTLRHAIQTLNRIWNLSGDHGCNIITNAMAIRFAVLEWLQYCFENSGQKYRACSLHIGADVGSRCALELETCRFFTDEIDHLENAICPNTLGFCFLYNKRDRQQKLPRTGSKLQRFLRFFTEYRCFVSNFSRIASLLCPKKNQRNWNCSTVCPSKKWMS